MPNSGRAAHGSGSAALADSIFALGGHIPATWERSSSVLPRQSDRVGTCHSAGTEGDPHANVTHAAWEFGYPDDVGDAFVTMRYRGSDRAIHGHS